MLAKITSAVPTNVKAPAGSLNIIIPTNTLVIGSRVLKTAALLPPIINVPA